MKKLFLFLACVTMVAPCFAQNEGKDLFDSGKSLFSKYDQMQINISLGQTVDRVEMSGYLMEGYDYLMKALPLDTIIETEKDGTPKIDKKTGAVKFKTKYSKDIVEIIAGHHNDFGNAGNVYYEASDYLNAAKAWELYCNIIPNSEYLGKLKPVFPDSMSYMFYYTGLMYSQVGDHSKALSNFKLAMAKGYTSQDVKDGLKYEFYTVANDYYEAKDYDNSLAVINEAIATDPGEAFYVMYKGVIIESQTNDIEQAIDYYKTATELDPTLSMAQFNVGRYYYNKAVMTMNAEENQDLNNDELGELIDPLCKQAKPYIDRAVELDVENTNSEARRIQQWIDDRLSY